MWKILTYFVGTVVGSEAMRADLELCRRPVIFREDALREAVAVVVVVVVGGGGGRWGGLGRGTTSRRAISIMNGGRDGKSTASSLVIYTVGSPEPSTITGDREPRTQYAHTLHTHVY